MTTEQETVSTEQVAENRYVNRVIRLLGFEPPVPPQYREYILTHKRLGYVPEACAKAVSRLIRANEAV